MASRNATKLIQQIMKRVTSVRGFDKNLSKLQIVSAGDGKCTAEMTVDEEHQNRQGTLHAGLTTTLVDIVSANAYFSTKPEDVHMPVSVDINVVFMNAAKVGTHIVIEADTLKMGKKFAFYKVDISNKDTGMLIATGSHTLYVG
ncbi:Acyl-coenzyme A thioesterase 13 [Halocaridina rubra]|uniref:Acyl-coenzyme A thioesterase 13 n=1 Tax=Halocaridina rubra TaxID=373956 RepID=A0AAN8X0W2_HALRR